MENQNGNFQQWAGIRATYGEILSTGVVLELVESSTGDGVELLRWDGQSYETGPQFQDGGTIYTAGYLHSSLREATRLARGPAEYGDAGKFFWKIGDLFRRYMGRSREQAAFLTKVLFGSWFSDLSASPTTLCITGMAMHQIMTLFRLLHILCRRPLMVAQLSTNLPLFLHPTLLVNVPRMSTSTGDFWRASNHRGAYIPGPRGTMRNISCPKIFYCETEAARRPWAPEALHIALPPTCQEFASLSEVEESSLAAEYQPQLLMFRLRNLSLRYQSDVSSCHPKFGGPGGDLPACIAEDPEIRKVLMPLLEAHELDLQASRARDPHVAILESIWNAAHQEKEISTAEITTRVNALLHKRGEILRYNSKQIGWRLRNLGLCRRHNGTRKAVLFSREARHRIHELAAQFGLRLPKVADCEDCKGAQLIAQE